MPKRKKKMPDRRQKKEKRDMKDFFSNVRVYATEIAATAVFLVFVFVEAWSTIKGLLAF